MVLAGGINRIYVEYIQTFLHVWQCQNGYAFPGGLEVASDPKASPIEQEKKWRNIRPSVLPSGCHNTPYSTISTVFITLWKGLPGLRPGPRFTDRKARVCRVHRIGSSIETSIAQIIIWCDSHLRMNVPVAYKHGIVLLINVMNEPPCNGRMRETREERRARGNRREEATLSCKAYGFGISSTWFGGFMRCVEQELGKGWDDGRPDKIVWDRTVGMTDGHTDCALWGPSVSALWTTWCEETVLPLHQFRAL